MGNYTEDYSQLDVSQEEKDKLVADVMRYVLFKYHQSGCPIKRDELVRLITKNYRQRSLPSYIINDAQKKLSSIFGYEMRELQRTRPSIANQGPSSQQSSAEVKSYVIASQLPDKVYQKFVENKENSHLTGLQFLVIGTVHLAGGKVSEENMWDHLRRVGLNDNGENHPDFGNIKEAVEALVQQRYLQKGKVNGPEGSILMYELAEKAVDEPVLGKVKEYLEQVVREEIVSIDEEDD